MHDAVTVTLIILIVALLRRSLLTDPGAENGARAGGEKDGYMTLAPVPVRVDHPHTTRQTKPKR